MAKSTRPALRLRVAGLVVTALIGSILAIWISRTTWERVDHLQHEFGGIQAENFYLGVRMRADIQRMNENLLRYRLRGDASDAETFRSGTQQFKELLERCSTRPSPALESEFFGRLRSAFSDYLGESMKVLEASRARWESTQAREFRDTYEKVHLQSQVLLRLCDTFVEDQRASFEKFLRQSTQTLAQFEQLLKLSLGLVLALAGALFVQVSRGMIAPLRDELTHSQAVIARQEKLASLGVLAAGVAHEIRNPLTAIKFRIFSLRSSMPGAPPDHEDLVVIAAEIERLERIVRDFLKFARPSEPHLAVIPARELLEEVSDLLKPQLDKANIELKLEATGPVRVRVDPQQIKQVLINLVQNSAESIGRDGCIVLRASAGTHAGRRGRQPTVQLEVADNGSGMPTEVQKRLFDPFFTTKEGGSGLGLPIAARIVDMHGGELRYQTVPNEGTTFCVVLPSVTDHEIQDPNHRG